MGVRSSRCCCPWTRSSSRLCLMTVTCPENSKCPIIRLQLLVMWLFSPMCFLRVPLHHPSQLKRHEGQDGVGSVALSFSAERSTASSVALFWTRQSVWRAVQRTRLRRCSARTVVASFHEATGQNYYARKAVLQITHMIG